MGDPPLGTSELCEVSEKELAATQRIFDETWKAQSTRDRKGSKLVHRMTVVKVLHNENKALWRRYLTARRKIRDQIDGLYDFELFAKTMGFHDLGTCTPEA